ncbi:lysine N(6)-hydroxylase/L-ornithine N(5)-oxygenase family protein [Pseudonocardia humida]|uniref:lysine N(6)-hydroxylase/L-ornithine N(5)-oxygenase family protein n=1 Tax=Pseudonocardia humida TaxID=2800819 RepID=UPI00207CE21F|nr:lysine N(6)-hydroxylase/L-ornithine N(5)-oxygenase family protein [Pseudonocardia humida]
MATTTTATQIVDVLGIGFGPSNLALAIALAEDAGNPDGPRAVFLERQPAFGWHRGMLIEDARMQVSFLKDLATLRNPWSRYSFLSYLHDRGRMSEFINTQNFFPTRLEFHDYLEWAAAGVAERVRYGTEVRGVRPVGTGAAARWEVHAATPDGEARYLARDVVVGTGLAPHLPPGVDLDDRVWHNCDLVHRVRALAGTRPRRFVVVGAGQSAAESVDYLHRSFPSAEVCSVFARYGFSPADDSPFANRIFDPRGVDDYFDAPQPTKDRLMADHRNTNYSVVDPELIRSLHDRHYAERVEGRERLRFRNVSAVTALHRGDDGVRVVVRSDLDGQETALAADAVVFATGYRSGDPARFFGSGPRWRRDALGRLAISRDYRLLDEDALPDAPRRVFVHGATEHTHGIGSSLLSNVAVRAGEIARALVEGHRAQAARDLDELVTVPEGPARNGRAR